MFPCWHRGKAYASCNRPNCAPLRCLKQSPKRSDLEKKIEKLTADLESVQKKLKPIEEYNNELIQKQIVQDQLMRGNWRGIPFQIFFLSLSLRCAAEAGCLAANC